MAELGTTTDPVALIPGSYATVHTLAASWRSRSEAATDLRDGLRALDVESAWQGYPYEKYVARADYVESSWVTCGEQLMSGARTMVASRVRRSSMTRVAMTPGTAQAKLESNGMNDRPDNPMRAKIRSIKNAARAR